MQYIEERSFRNDIKICFKTVKLVLFSKDPGAY
nr:hypothetical protein [Oenococcus oeni]